MVDYGSETFVFLLPFFYLKNCKYKNDAKIIPKTFEITGGS